MAKANNPDIISKIAKDDAIKKEITKIKSLLKEVDKNKIKVVTSII